MIEQIVPRQQKSRGTTQQKIKEYFFLAFQAD